MIRFESTLILIVTVIIPHCSTEADEYFMTEDELILNYDWEYIDIYENAISYSNKWVIKAESAEKLINIANDKGFHYHGEIEGLSNHFLIEKHDQPNQQQRKSSHHTNELLEDENVAWVKQLYYKQLNKRDFLYKDEFRNNFNHQNMKEILNNLKGLYNRKLQLIRSSLSENNFEVDDETPIVSTYDQEFNDELWTLQWYELGYRINSITPIVDMNLVPVYREYNVTGSGINIAIVDDGIEYTHEDIRDNFNPDISFNLNFNKKNVLPRYEDSRNRHGTRCAGVIAMKANNKKCGVGIAYNAKVGGITLLDGVTSDLMEYQAITFANNLVDIYSGSWGPQDNGQAMDGPGPLVHKGLYSGVKNGRNGLGSLYVFAAGNGGIFQDHCGADGYVNNIYSIPVASAAQGGGIPYYSERCPAILTTTYSGSQNDEVKIIATDVHNNCTLEHSGTSASAPILAGILALVLEVNNNLSWRDVQHLLVQSSEMVQLTQDVDWALNGFSLWYTPQFGFGLINAYKMVTLAKTWITVPEKYICTVPFTLGNKRSRKLSAKKPFIIAAKIRACNDTIRYLEHVQLNLTVQYSIRGHLEVKLISPSATVSNVLEPRKYDESAEGFRRWFFLSVQFWGEQAAGTWAVIVSDQLAKESGRRHGKGRVHHVQLILHGTKDIPNHYASTRFSA